MKLSQFKFRLPEEQVALYPPHRTFKNEDGTVERIYNRDQSRLMVIHRKRQEIEMYKKDADGNATDAYLSFRDIVDYFDEGDTFVFNNTKVFPARLYGTKEKKLVACGYGQLEKLYDAYQAMDKTPRETPQILIAPSWQTDNILDTCIDDVLKYLLGQGYRVIVRPHPEYKKRYRPRLDALVNRWQDYQGGDLVFETDFSGNDTIYGSDVVITDWSGTAYEFSLVTLRPSIFINTPPKINNPDYAKIGIEPLEFSLRSRVGVTIDPDKLDQLPGQVKQVLAQGERYESEILAIRNQYIANFGESGRACYRAIMDAIKEHGGKQS